MTIKKISKQILVWVLLVAMLMTDMSFALGAWFNPEPQQQMVSTGIFAEDGNDYIRFGIDVGCGGFYILPAGDESEEGKPLSRAMFLIDGEAIPFGTLTGDERASLSPVFVNDYNAHYIVWTFDGYTVTQFLQIREDGTHEGSYAVSVVYGIVRHGAPTGLPMRIVLDTRFGAQDDRPVMTADGHSFTYEQTFEPAPEGFFSDEELDEGERVTYLFLGEDVILTPERVTVASIERLLASGFDFEPDPEYHFTESGSGVAMYFSIAASAEEQFVGFVYGFMPAEQMQGTLDEMWAKLMQQEQMQINRMLSDQMGWTVEEILTAEEFAAQMFGNDVDRRDDLDPFWQDLWNTSLLTDNEQHDILLTENVPAITEDILPAGEIAPLAEPPQSGGTHFLQIDAAWAAAQWFAEKELTLSWDGGSVTLEGGIDHRTCPHFIDGIFGYAVEVPANMEITVTTNGHHAVLEQFLTVERRWVRIPNHFNSNDIAGRILPHVPIDITLTLPEGAIAHLSGTYLNRPFPHGELLHRHVGPMDAEVVTVHLPSLSSSLYVYTEPTLAGPVDGWRWLFDGGGRHPGFTGSGDPVTPAGLHTFNLYENRTFRVQRDAELTLLRAGVHTLMVVPQNGIAALTVAPNNMTPQTFTRRGVFGEQILHHRPTTVTIDYLEQDGFNAPIFNDFEASISFDRVLPGLPTVPITRVNYRTFTFNMPFEIPVTILTVSAQDAMRGAYSPAYSLAYLELPDAIEDVSISWTRSFPNVGEVTRTLPSYRNRPIEPSTTWQMSPMIPFGAEVTIAMTGFTDARYEMDDFNILAETRASNAAPGTGTPVDVTIVDDTLRFTMPETHYFLYIKLVDTTIVPITINTGEFHNWDIDLRYYPSGDPVGDSSLVGSEIRVTASSTSAFEFSVSAEYLDWTGLVGDLHELDLDGEAYDFIFTVPRAREARLNFEAERSRTFVWNTLSLDLLPEEEHADAIYNLRKGNFWVSGPSRPWTPQGVITDEHNIVLYPGDQIGFLHERHSMDYALVGFNIYPRVMVSPSTDTSPAVFRLGDRINGDVPVMQEAIEAGSTGFHGANPVYAFAPNNGRSYRSLANIQEIIPAHYRPADQYNPEGTWFSGIQNRPIGLVRGQRTNREIQALFNSDPVRFRSWRDRIVVNFDHQLPTVGQFGGGADDWTMQDLIFVPVYREVQQTVTISLNLPRGGEAHGDRPGMFRDGIIIDDPANDWRPVRTGPDAEPFAWTTDTLMPGQEHTVYIYLHHMDDFPHVRFAREEFWIHGRSFFDYVSHFPLSTHQARIERHIGSDGRVFARLTFQTPRWNTSDGIFEIGLDSRHPFDLDDLYENYERALIQQVTLNSPNISNLREMTFVGQNLRQMAEDDMNFAMLNDEQRARTRRIDLTLWGICTLTDQYDRRNEPIWTGTVGEDKISFYGIDAAGRDIVRVDLTEYVGEWLAIPPPVSTGMWSSFSLTLGGDGWRTFEPLPNGGEIVRPDFGGWVIENPQLEHLGGPRFNPVMNTQHSMRINADPNLRDTNASMVSVVQFVAYTRRPWPGGRNCNMFDYRYDKVYQYQFIMGDSEAEILAQAERARRILTANDLFDRTWGAGEIILTFRGEVRYSPGTFYDTLRHVDGDGRRHYWPAWIPGQITVGEGGGDVLINDTLIYSVREGGDGITLAWAGNPPGAIGNTGLTHNVRDVQQRQVNPREIRYRAGFFRVPNSINIDIMSELNVLTPLYRRKVCPDFNPNEPSFFVSAVAPSPVIIAGADGRLRSPGFPIPTPATHDITIELGAIDYTFAEYDRSRNVTIDWMPTMGYDLMGFWRSGIEISDIALLDNALVFGGWAAVTLPIPMATPLVDVRVPRLQFGRGLLGDFTLQGMTVDARANLSAQNLGILRIPGLMCADKNASADIKARHGHVFGTGAGGRIHACTFTHTYGANMFLRVKNKIDIQGHMEFLPHRSGYFPVPDSVGGRISVWPGIDLIPGTPIGTLRGGGASVSGLAATINAEFNYIPPVRLSISTQFEIMKKIQLEVMLTVGVGTAFIDANPKIGPIRPFSRFRFGLESTDQFVRIKADIEMAIPHQFPIVAGGGFLQVIGIFPDPSTGRGGGMGFDGTLHAVLQVPPSIPILGGMRISGGSAGISEAGVFGQVYKLGVTIRHEFRGLGDSAPRVFSLDMYCAEYTQTFLDDDGEFAGEFAIGGNLRRVPRGGGFMPFGISAQNSDDNVLVISAESQFVTVPIPRGRLVVERQVNGNWEPFELVWATPTGSYGEYTVDDLDRNLHPDVTAADLSGFDPETEAEFHNIFLKLPLGTFRFTDTDGDRDDWFEILNHIEAAPLPALTEVDLNFNAVTNIGTVTLSTANLTPGTNYVAHVYLEGATLFEDEDGEMNELVAAQNVHFLATSKDFSSTNAADIEISFALPNELPSGLYTVNVHLREQCMEWDYGTDNWLNYLEFGYEIFPVFRNVSTLAASDRINHANPFTPNTVSNADVGLMGNGLMTIAFPSVGEHVFYRIEALDEHGANVPMPNPAMQRLVQASNDDPDTGDEYQMAGVDTAEPLMFIVAPSVADDNGNMNAVVGNLRPGEYYSFRITPFVYIDEDGVVAEEDLLEWVDSNGDVFVFEDDGDDPISEVISVERSLPILEGAPMTTDSLFLPVPQPPLISFAAVTGSIERNEYINEITLRSFGMAQFTINVSEDAEVEVFLLNPLPNNGSGNGNIEYVPLIPDADGVFTVNPDIHGDSLMRQIVAVARNGAGDTSEAIMTWHLSDPAPMLFVMTDGGDRIVTTEDTFTVSGLTSPGATITVSAAIANGGTAPLSLGEISSLSAQDDLTFSDVLATGEADERGNFEISGLLLADFPSGLVNVTSELNSGVTTETVGVVWTQAPPRLTDGTIVRIDDMTAQVGFTADRAGIVHYMVMDAMNPEFMTIVTEETRTPVLDDEGYPVPALRFFVRWECGDCGEYVDFEERDEPGICSVCGGDKELVEYRDSELVFDDYGDIVYLYQIHPGGEEFFVLGDAAPTAAAIRDSGEVLHTFNAPGSADGLEIELTAMQLIRAFSDAEMPLMDKDIFLVLEDEEGILSEPMLLTVTQDAQRPNIVTQPQSRTVNVDTAIALEVEAVVMDGGTLTYQWYRATGASGDNFERIVVGATGRTFTPDTSAEGVNRYRVVVTNTHTIVGGVQTATVTSATATVTVNTLINAGQPTITAQPQDAAVNRNDAVNLAVTATSPDGGSLSYQWYKSPGAAWEMNGFEVIDGATNAAFAPDTSAVGVNRYRVVVTNTIAAAPGTGELTAAITSDIATVTVETQTPFITAQPQSRSVDAGQLTDLTVAANVTDGGTLSFQWYRSPGAEGSEFAPIDDAAEATFTPDTSAVGANRYCVVITNTHTTTSGDRTAAVTSSIVTVTVSRASGAAVTAPTLVGTPTANSVTMETSITSPNPGNQTVEFARSTTNTVPADGWQSNGTFTGLEEYTQYYFFARTAVNATHDAGTPSAGTAIRTADETPPTGEITIRDNGFTSFLNTITFGLFFRNTVDVTITAADAHSGVASVEHFRSETALPDTTDWGSLTWTVGNSFSVTANWQGIVYARITDNAGNVTVINSNGVVVFTDSAPIATGSFDRASANDLRIDIAMNGNTVREITWGGIPIGTDNFAVGDNYITFTNEYLRSLPDGDAVFTVTWNPLGVTATQTGGDTPGTSTIIVTITTPAHAPVITITTQPANATVIEGAITGSLSVTAGVTQDATLSYQWYVNTTADNIGGTPIPGAMGASFAIPTALTAGTHHFYVVVRATGGAAPVASNVATVTVNAAGGQPPVDRTALQTLITQKTTLDRMNYTIATWNAAANALGNAQAVLDDENATQEQINDAYTALQNAKNALVTIASIPHPFTDVVVGSWYENAVQFAFANDIVGGTSPTTFAPGTQLTRAMMVTILYNMEGRPDVDAEPIFYDVTAGEWYSNAVVWAYENNIVSGVGGNRFAPGVNITREQLATIMHSFAGFKGFDTAVRQGAGWDDFTDLALISWWAEDALMWANYHEIVSGMPGPRIAPDGNATRAEVVQIIINFVRAFGG